jgi:CDP-glycerol glycerophosphotransferase (TagB/SpsB family)
MKKIKDSIKFIKLKDLLSPFMLIVAVLPALVFKIYNKIRKRNLWLICEEGNVAKDNGYHFYKYIRTQHPNDFCFFVIDKKSKDFKKVEQLGNIIQFESLKHWVYYLAADYNISTQKMGNPNKVLFYILHVSLGLMKNRVFLQHGITVNDSPWIYYKNTKFRYFICGAKKEYEYIKEKFGYPEENVVYTGFARFDNLYNNKENEKQILVMPTWRTWLGRDRNFLSDGLDFTNTEYFKKWNGFLNNKELVNYIENHDYTLYFYPHYNMQNFIEYFKVNSKNIKIVGINTSDIQELLKESKVLITDYSSVFMDFAYMNKPSILYQFDYDEYREKHLGKGYFDYKKDGFGPVVNKEEDLTKKLVDILENGLEEKYKKRNNNFFELRDQKNCERIYNVLKGNK